MNGFFIGITVVIGSFVSVFAQGHVLFSTSVSNATPPISAPVVLGDGTGPGPSFNAGLYLVSDSDTYLIESSVTTFRGGHELAQRFVVPKVAIIPGHPGGTQVTLLFRMWRSEFGSWESSDIRGQGLPFTVTLSSPPNPPADPFGITGFAIPEPSTLILGVLGVAALLLRRRK